MRGATAIVDHSPLTKDIVARFGAKPEALLQILHAFVERFGYVPPEAIPTIASALNLSRAEVHGVVSFYHDFRTEPPGTTVIRVCQAEACQAMGSRELTEHARKRLGIGLGETSADGKYTLEAVYCLGNCALSPALMAGDRVHGRVDSASFDCLLDAH